MVCHVRIGAVPARGTWQTFVQSDGTSIRVRLCGDENMHYYLTEDGVPLVRESGGDLCYADAFGFGMKSSGILAHESGQRTAAELRHAATVEAVETVAGVSARRAVVAERRAVRRAAATRSTYTGERRGLVIMVNFPDRDFSDGDARSDWEAILNAEGFSDNGANGSVSDYFRDQSSGAFNLAFDLVGPVTAANNRYYYGANDRWDRNIDLNMGELVVEACEAVRGEVDFSDYDWDGDGRVDQVFILYAGGGEAVTGADSRLIWPHEYYVSAYAGYSGGYEIDGMIIDTYACGSELAGLESAANPPLSGLGTFCHVFSHGLGLPDLYTYTGLDMLGDWDLLASGNYNADGWCPPNYTAYERMFCGWAPPVELDAPATVIGLQPMSAGGLSYLVRNDAADGSADEYYLIENRCQEGWDAYIPGSGLIITHVDYDESKWRYNTVNDTYSHPGVSIFPASNIYKPDGNIAYPYLGNDSLTDNSRPVATVYNATSSGSRLMGKPITGITRDGAAGTVSFDFMGGDSNSGSVGIAAPEAERSAAGKPAVVYDAAGRCVVRTDSYSGLDDSLPSGIYIVKSSSGTTLKIAKQ